MRLSKTAAQQLGYGRTATDEKAAREARVQQHAQRMAERDKARAERRQQTAADNEKVAAARNAALAADERLAFSLDDFGDIVRAFDPKEREVAALTEKAAAQADRDAHEAHLRSFERLMEARAAHKTARAAREHLDQLAQQKLPETRARLRAEWEANNGAWMAVQPAYRKEKRNRSLKNRVKGLLGIKLDVDG